MYVYFVTNLHTHRHFLESFGRIVTFGVVSTNEKQEKPMKTQAVDAAFFIFP